MGTKYWAPFLHFYQPPGQLPHVLRRVVEESYRPLLEVFRHYSHAKVTVNINGVLTEMLYEHNYQDVIDGLRELAEAGQLEFVGSGKYHPILPLIPKEEMERQIRRNYLTNRHFFGDVYQPRGFFPPEMCYDRDIVDAVVESRHEWILIGGVACPVAWPMNVIHQIAHDEARLAILFRDDILSNKISFQTIDGKGFIEHLRHMGSDHSDVYVITAMDAETFGHHIQNWERLFLAEVYDALGPASAATAAALAELPAAQPIAQQHRGLLTMPQTPVLGEEVRVVTISELLDIFPRGRTIEPKASSWSTTADDIAQGNPYPLWKHHDNYIHKLQWQHVDLTMEMVTLAEEVADNDRSRRYASIARALLDEALHSCQFWWASKRPHWDVNMANRGLTMQRDVIFNAFKAINLSDLPEDGKKEAYYRVVASRDVANKLLDQLFWD